MAHPSVTIDLGELPRDQPPRADGQWPGWARLRHRLGRSPWRLIAAAATTGAVLLAVSAAAPSPQSMLSLHFAFRATAVTVDSEYLYAVDRPGRPGGGGVLTAYRLADGGVDWRASHDALGDSAHVYRHGQRLLLLTMFYGLEDSLREGQVTLLNETGVPVWTVPGDLLPPIGDRLLVREPLAPADDRADAGPGPPVRHRYAALDPGSGEPVWQREIEGWRTAVVPESQRLLDLDSAGELTAYDLATGALVGSVAAIDAGTEPLQQLELALHRPGSLALVTYTNGLDSVISAFDTDSLTERWARRYRAGDVFGTGGPRTQPCGALVCLSSHGLGTPVALDPATGERLWSADWVSQDPDRTVFITTPEHPRLADYLVLSDWSGQAPASWLIDASTGEPVLEMRDWRMAAAPDRERPPLVVSGGGGGVTGPSTPDSLVGLLRHDPPRVQPLGAIAQRHGSCDAWSGYVVCRAGAGAGEDVTVWRVRV